MLSSPPPLTHHPPPLTHHHPPPLMTQAPPPPMTQAPTMNHHTHPPQRQSRETPVYSCTSCSFKCDVLHDLKEHVKTHAKPTPVNCAAQGVSTGNDNITDQDSWQGDERPYMLQAINVVLDLLT